jgi:hypothetical protein
MDRVENNPCPLSKDTHPFYKLFTDVIRGTKREEIKKRPI